VILTEVTARDDLHPLLAFLKREFEALAYADHRFTLANVTNWADAGLRWATLEEDGRITAALGVSPFVTGQSRGYSVPYLIVAGDHPDKILAFDALCLFGCNRLRNEGVRLVQSPAVRRPRIAYGSDYAGLKRGDDLTCSPDLQVGTPEDVIQAILARRPQWRTSLSSMTAT
jgi:hypothetical protein